MPTPTAAGRAVACHGGWRILRTSAVASIAVLIAVCGHLAGAGAAPNAGLMALVIVVASALSAKLSRQRWSARTLTGTLLATQALMHVLCSLQPGTSTETHDGLMVAWHLVATAVSLGVLMYGETLAWRMVDVIALRPVRAALGVVAVASWRVLRTPRVLGAPELLGGSLWERSLAPVRGPPA